MVQPSAQILQIILLAIQNWFKTWRMKANGSKSIHVTFTLDSFDTPLTILNYNLQWCSLEFSVTVYIALSLFHSNSLQLTTHALRPLGLLSHTNPLVPGSNGGWSPSWIPELSVPHSHSDPQCTLHLELPLLVPIYTVWKSPNNRLTPSVLLALRM
jgi:hypothetical protein